MPDTEPARHPSNQSSRLFWSSLETQSCPNVSVTGDGPIHPRYPNDPVTHTQIADASLEAAATGASIVHIFMNTPGKLRPVADVIRQASRQTGMEALNPGGILLARRLTDEGNIDAPPLFQICLDVKWSALADAKTLIFMKDLPPPGAIWTAFGISPYQADNGQLVERSARIIADPGREVARPAETLDIFKLGPQT